VDDFSGPTVPAFSHHVTICYFLTVHCTTIMSHTRDLAHWMFYSFKTNTTITLAPKLKYGCQPKNIENLECPLPRSQKLRQSNFGQDTVLNVFVVFLSPFRQMLG
jgi:hypothetical protein